MLRRTDDGGIDVAIGMGKVDDDGIETEDAEEETPDDAAGTVANKSCTLSDALPPVLRA